MNPAQRGSGFLRDPRSQSWIMFSSGTDGELEIYDYHVQSPMAGSSLTSIPVHSNVVRRLRSLKSADQTWDDFLMDMADDYVPPGWYDEIERRRGPGADIPMDQVLQRSRELHRKGA